MAEETIQASPCLPDTAVCLQCGYSLRMLPDNRCPECGRAFNPADSESFWDTTRPAGTRSIWHRWAAPPPLWHSVLAVLVTVLLADFMHNGDTWPGDFPFSLLTRAAAIGLAFTWLLRRWAVARCTWSKWNRAEFLTPGVRRRWLVTPLCALFMGLSGASLFISPALDLRLWISMPFLYAKSSEIRQPGAAAQYNCWVGILHFRRVLSVADGRARFDWLSGYNLVHDPDHVGPKRQQYLFPWSQDWALKDWGKPP